LALAGYWVVITADDGYSVTIHSSDIIRNNDYIVASTLNGNHLPDTDSNWPLRLVGPAVSGPLSISQIVRIDLVKNRGMGFAATQTYGATGLEVQFVDQTSCNPTSWSWDFGDGGVSNEQNPVHVYTNPGPFTVNFTISGGSCENETFTKVDYIHAYTIGVGGEASSVNRTGIVLPWILLGGAIICGIIIVVKSHALMN
jgi:hypothetical protein